MDEKIIEMNIKKQIETMYDQLFELQSLESKLFHKAYKGGKIDLTVQGQWVSVRQQVIQRFDELKEFLTTVGKEYVIHLQWGNIYNASSYTINESRQSISCNETSRWVYRGLYDIK